MITEVGFAIDRLGYFNENPQAITELTLHWALLNEMFKILYEKLGLRFSLSAEDKAMLGFLSGDFRQLILLRKFVKERCKYRVLLAVRSVAMDEPYNKFVEQYNLFSKKLDEILSGLGYPFAEGES